MEHTHKISSVDVHSGPGPHNGFRSYQSLGMILEVYSWHMYSQTQ